MKKFILLAALCCGSALTAHAQTSAGTILLGGGLSFSRPSSESTSSYNSQTNTSKGTQFSLSPRAGYFLADNLVLGLDASYSHSTSENEGHNSSGNPSISKAKGNGYQLGPFVRYYKMLGDKAGFFGHATAGYSHSRNESKSEDSNLYESTYKGHGYYASLAPGFAYFPTPKVGLEVTLGSIGYGSYTNEITDSFPQEPMRTSKQTNSGFGANLSLSSLSIGAAVYLGR